MEQVLRIIIEGIVRMLAWIPLGGFSLTFIAGIYISIRAIVLWVTKGIWHIPRIFEMVNTDFLSVIMDDKVSDFRLPLIKLAAKTAVLPAPVFLIFSGIFCLSSGLLLLYLANAIKAAGNNRR